MKFTLITLFALVAVGSSYVVPQEDGVALVHGVIDDLIRKVLECVRKVMTDKGYIALPNIPQQHLVDDDVDLVGDFSNGKASNAENFVIKKIKTSIFSMSADIELQIPTLHIEANYEGSGTAWKRSVSGSGLLKVDVTNIAQTIKTKFSIGKSVQMKSLTIDYDIDALQIDVSGLTVEGMTSQQVEDFFNNQLIVVLDNNKDFVCQKVAAHAMSVVNKLINGKSLLEIIAWVEQMIHA